MGSCFLATELGIPNAGQLPNHASYLGHWLRAMQNDTRFIFQASSQASKAADYILPSLVSKSRKKSRLISRTRWSGGSWLPLHLFLTPT